MQLQLIDRWVPCHWDEFVGNAETKEHFRSILRAAHRSERLFTNTFVYGPSRSGKTSMVKFFAKCLLCEQLDPNSLDPCGDCRNCLDKTAWQYGCRGLETMLLGMLRHFVVMDCTSISEVELKRFISEMSDYDGIRVVFLDEAHRLARRKMDQLLLKPVEDRDILWIASAVELKEIDPMVKNRFVKIPTQLPSEEELAIWLSRRCKSWKLEVDNADTLLLLAERASCVPGLTLQVLARADQAQDRCVTHKLVQRHQFEVDE